LKEVLGFETFKKILTKKGATLRRLATFGDGIEKVRIIAISDWISQSTLAPLHHLIFSRLKFIKEDYTHDQLRSIETIKL